MVAWPAWLMPSGLMSFLKVMAMTFRSVIKDT
jgi:hypothetical protein